MTQFFLYIDRVSTYFLIVIVEFRITSKLCFLKFVTIELHFCSDVQDLKVAQSLGSFVFFQSQSIRLGHKFSKTYWMCGWRVR